MEKIKILIVNDREEQLELQSGILEDMGLEIITCLSGKKALEQVLENNFAVILLDIAMPEMDGFETASLIRQRRRSAEVPIIFITAYYLEDADKMKGYSFGAADYIVTPIIPAILRTKVKIFADIYRMRQEIEEANLKLKELNHLKDKFFSIIDHDLKNPFTALLSMSEILIEDIKDNELAQAINDANAIREASLSEYKLLENLFEWAKIQIGKYTLKKTNINFSNITSEVFDLFNPLSLAKNIQIKQEIDSSISVLVDSNMLRTILRNLITNAIKFTHYNGEIVVGAEYSEGQVLIKVMDNGVGIEEEDIKKLFRLDEKLIMVGTNNETGTGLGLILCKEFVEKNDGKIWLESKPGKGTTCYFTLTEEGKE